ncbi:MAG: CoA transferase, partial [Hyphomicrobiales bacterium]
MIGLLGNSAALAWFNCEDPKPQGAQHLKVEPYGAFPVQDGSFIITILTILFWGKICATLALPPNITDPRYDSNLTRCDAREVVNAIVPAVTQQHSVAELVELFTRYEVPHAP